MVTEKRRLQISSVLDELSTQHNIRILYACESGSRAWGFASRDSDYDVRFIYARDVDWYLSVDIEDRSDVIDLPIDDLLDVGGWDLRKAINLMRKSNSPLLEWLGSPVVYEHSQGFLPEFTELAEKNFSPIASAFHYLSMARKNAESVWASDQVKLKKYFYLLRPLLALRWLEIRKSRVPTEFSKMLIPEILPDNLRTEIDQLLKIKADSTESDWVSRNPTIDEFVQLEIPRLESVDFAHPRRDGTLDEINHFFRRWIKTSL